MKRTSGLTALALCFVVVACGPNFRAPSIDESGSETATDVSERAPAAAAESVRTLSLDQATNVRNLKSGVLEFVAELPPGAKITVPNDYQISQPDVRNSAGSVERSSTGFVAGVQIVSASTLTAQKIAAFNKLGLYISATIVGANEGADGSWKAIAGAAPSSAYLTLYSTDGKPKFNFTASLKKRFGDRMNKVADSFDSSKSKKILAQLALAANRKVASPKSILLIDKEAAKKFSVAYEANGTVPETGAWSIAVNATAVRHGFPNVPCAEFMSETLREAYQRAGYSHAQDFPSAKNPLIWSKTAAVSGLSTALYTAGWGAWDASKYRPPVGAIMMHESGTSPGHTYLAAGDEGRLIVDNGSPQGRDLRTTSSSILKMMYKTGIFFLPPGVTPQAW